MSRFTRRTILQYGGSASLFGLAGCSRLNPLSPSETRLNEITVTNLDDNPHTAQVLIIKDREPIYSASVVIDGRGPKYGTVKEEDFTEFPKKLSNAVFFAWVDNQPTEKWEHFKFSSYDGDCVGLLLSIKSIEEQKQPSLTILTSSEC